MYDKVGEATALVWSLRQMLEGPLLDLKCIRLIQRLDILKMYLKELPEVVNESYNKVREDTLLLLSTYMQPSRTIKMQKVQDALKDRKVLHMCISELQNEDVLLNPYKIGEGAYGKVYKGIIAGVPTVLKSVDMVSLESETIPPDSTTIPLDLQPMEYKLGVALNDLILTDQCPNFMLTYDVGACITRRKYAMYFIEEASFDLEQAFEQRFFGPISHVSLLAQLLIALHYVHTRLHISHQDIKSSNILLLETPSLARSLMTYEVDGRTFVLENTGVIPCLADFGTTNSQDLFSPKIDVTDLLSTFFEPAGYPDLLPAYKNAIALARDRRYLPLDALQFILKSINYKPAEDLPISKVYKSNPVIAPVLNSANLRGPGSKSLISNDRGFSDDKLAEDLNSAVGHKVKDLNSNKRGFDKSARAPNRAVDKLISDNRVFDELAEGLNKAVDRRKPKGFISDNRGFD